VTQEKDREPTIKGRPAFTGAVLTAACKYCFVYFSQYCQEKMLLPAGVSKSAVYTVLRGLFLKYITSARKIFYPTVYALA
jgi:hypothetical protein